MPRSMKSARSWKPHKPRRSALSRRVPPSPALAGEGEGWGCDAASQISQTAQRPHPSPPPLRRRGDSFGASSAGREPSSAPYLSKCCAHEREFGENMN
jgi:hypothetical protein